MAIVVTVGMVIFTKNLGPLPNSLDVGIIVLGCFIVLLSTSPGLLLGLRDHSSATKIP